MKIGEVSLHTTDVVRLSNFYKALFEIDNGSNDPWHQVLLNEETTLTVYYDETAKNPQNPNISLAFTVDDIQQAYQKLLRMDVQIIEPPTLRPWGAINLHFLDPDGNRIYFRQFTKHTSLIRS